MPEIEARALATDPATAGPAAVRIGDLVFTTCAGVGTRPENIRTACDGAYDQIQGWLAEAQAGPVVRLDHFTESQSWLGDRQASRAAHFGAPAPLASTGIATIADPADLLHAAAVASATPEATPEVTISGAAHGMPHIATAVRLGSVHFISGLLGSADQGQAQIAAVFDQLSGIVADLGLRLDDVRRIDCYAADAEALAAIEAEIDRRWTTRPARLQVLAGFAPGQLLEITALAVEPDRGGFAPISTDQVDVETEGLDDEARLAALRTGVEALARAADRRGIARTGWARLDVAFSDDRDLQALRHALTSELNPVIVSRRSAPIGSSTIRLALLGG